MKFLDSVGLLLIMFFWSIYCCSNISKKLKTFQEEDEDNIKINMDEKLFCCGTPPNSPRLRSNSRFFNSIDDYL